MNGKVTLAASERAIIDCSPVMAERLFDWLVKHGEENECGEIRLVSRVAGFDAHRFHLNRRMIFAARYFSRRLKNG